MTRLSPCVQCGKARKMPPKLKVARVHYINDEFCSRKCCETAHGIEHLTGHTAVYYGEE